MPTCPDCAYVHVQIKDRTGEFEYINIGEDVQYLKEFVRLRDKEAAFDECRKTDIWGFRALSGRWFCDRRAGESWTCVKTGR